MEPRAGKRKRQQYSEEKLEEALKAVHDGSPVSEISRRFCIPISTLISKSKAFKSKRRKSSSSRPDAIESGNNETAKLIVPKEEPNEAVEKNEESSETLEPSTESNETEEPNVEKNKTTKPNSKSNKTVKPKGVSSKITKLKNDLIQSPKKTKSKCKKRIKPDYSEEQLELALKALEDDNFIARISRQFNIPKEVISNAYKKRAMGAPELKPESRQLTDIIECNVTIEPTDEKEKRKRRPYSAEKLEEALKAVDNGNPVAKVSRQFDIPRSTLIAKISGQRPRSYSRPGPNAVLGTEIENKLVNWMIDCAKKGFPVNKRSVIFSAQTLITEGAVPDKKKLPFSGDGPGRKWYRNFTRRHPQVKDRRAEYQSRARASVTEDDIRAWFDELKTDLGNNMSIFEDPRRVFNADEASMYLHPKLGMVIVSRTQKLAFDAKEDEKQNTTVFITGNAAGEMAPSTAVYACKDIPDTVKALFPSENWRLEKSASGWMTPETFYLHIKDVFYPYLIKENIQLPVVLILDGHRNYMSLQVCEFCADKEIILVSLYPNTTHVLQPLDISFFPLLRKEWKRELRVFKSKNEGKEVCREHIAPIYDEILKREHFATTLKDGFLATGLCPFNPNAVHYEKCARVLNEMEEVEIIDESNREEDMRFVRRLESFVPTHVLLQFCKNLEDGVEWKGDESYKAMYNMWREYTLKLNQEGTRVVTLSEEPVSIDVGEYLIVSTATTLENGTKRIHNMKNLHDIIVSNDEVEENDTRDVNNVKEIHQVFVSSDLPMENGTKEIANVKEIDIVGTE